MISPRLVEVGRHPNIEIITDAEVAGLEGTTGSFRVTVHRKPRFIEASKCTACGDCAKACPVELPDGYNQGLTLRGAVHKRYPQAIPGSFSIQKGDEAPCRAACPAGINVQGYVQLVGIGKFEEALRLILEELPLPGVLGRICAHPCESACRRSEVDSPLAIRDLKRLASDMHDLRTIAVNRLPDREERVAIVGSGPAGLSAAYHLARNGVRPTIFEALPKAGGMLRAGIPNYRLPEEILDREIEFISSQGVEIRLNKTLGKEITLDGLLEEGFRAVFLAMGAHKGVTLGIPGEDLEGVCQGVDFLREANLSGSFQAGTTVGIIGGGNVAVDVARTLIRLGAKSVTLFCLESRDEMPAWEHEVEEAIEEGVSINHRVAPVEILSGSGRVIGVRLVRVELGQPDSAGRSPFIQSPGTEFEVEIDQLILAVGQKPDTSPLDTMDGLKFTEQDTIEVDPLSYATGKTGVFAGGDLHTGPDLAVSAVREGKDAAKSILRYLDCAKTDPIQENDTENELMLRPVPDLEPEAHREPMPLRQAAERKKDFSEVALGYDEDSGRREAKRCLNCGYCCECYQCVEACVSGALTLDTHGQKPETLELAVGSVIVAAGLRPFDPSRFYVYRYADDPDVMTAMEMERLLSSSGPTAGRLIRLSDRKEPGSIAWIQCVGSRNVNLCDHEYCSAVCCMYAVKQAVVAKEHCGSDLECTVFHMDMRTFGKDQEVFLNRARDSYGVHLIRSMPQMVDPAPGSDRPVLRYLDVEAGILREKAFDLVVLSTGLESDPDTLELLRRLDVETTHDGFVAVDPFRPVETSRPGVFAAGMICGPKDISSSVVEACAAANCVMCDLHEARGTDISPREIPEEMDVSEAPPRAGVFICNCGKNIGDVVDVPALCDYVKTLPGVVYATHNLFTCSQDTQENLKQAISEHNINRVVIAACSPMTHEPLFQETIQDAGLNRHLMEMANIRNQDSWVHGDEPSSATEKAKDLVRAAVSRASILRPLKENRIAITRRALVIGGGVSGMTAALGLADQGLDVVIVEKEASLGGLARSLSMSIEGADTQALVHSLVERVEGNERILVLTGSIVAEFSGFKGNFKTSVLVGRDRQVREVNHGGMIVATGAEEYTPIEFLYGEDDRVMTQMDLERRLEMQGAEDLKSVVMIQCVGSRNSENPNCSRVCCQSAVKNALRLSDLNPEAVIVILYRDMRTYGLLEKYYSEARRRGILFFRFEQDAPPTASIESGHLCVGFRDLILQRDMQFTPDALVLSAGMRPADTEGLSSILKLPRNAEGYFTEAHVKLRPVDMVSDGVFLCGTAHGPKLISESMSQALAASARAGAFLSRSELALSVITSSVDRDLCAACLACVRSCPWGVPKINRDGFSEIDPALCRGCGICAAECPANAIQLALFEDELIMSSVEALLQGSLK